MENIVRCSPPLRRIIVLVYQTSEIARSKIIDLFYNEQSENPLNVEHCARDRGGQRGKSHMTTLGFQRVNVYVDWNLTISRITFFFSVFTNRPKATSSIFRILQVRSVTIA